MINDELLKILRCPACVQTKEGTLEYYREAWLVCNECNRKYPIRQDIPVMLIGNKSDLVDKLALSHEDIKDEAKKREFSHIISSALTGENVNEAFTYLANRVLLTKDT